MLRLHTRGNNINSDVRKWPVKLMKSINLTVVGRVFSIYCRRRGRRQRKAAANLRQTLFLYHHHKVNTKSCLVEKNKFIRRNFINCEGADKPKTNNELDVCDYMTATSCSISNIGDFSM